MEVSSNALPAIGLEALKTLKGMLSLSATLLTAVWTNCLISSLLHNMQKQPTLLSQNIANAYTRSHNAKLNSGQA